MLVLDASWSRRVLAAHALLLLGGCNSVPQSDGSSAEDDVVGIEMLTGLGTIELEVYPSRAPITVANFLRYVDAESYDDGSFYRTVRLDNQQQSTVLIEVIQGGLGMVEMTPDNPPERFPPIRHETTAETGILHADGVISMARLEPGSASSEFFICVGDQPSLDFGGQRNPDGQGFAAFGRVTSGMDVVRRIQGAPADAPVGAGLADVRGQMMVNPVPITSIRRRR